MTDLPAQQNNSRKDLRNNIIVGILSVILIIVLVLFFIQRKQNTAIVGDLEAKRDSIQVELTEMVANYDSLRTENDTINEMLTMAQTRVRDLLIEVQQTKKVSNDKIEGYQKELTTLRAITKDLYFQVDSLHQRNMQLMAENTQVKEQAKQAEMKSEQLSKEKEALQQNLKRAAMLEVRELLAEGLNDRDKETKFARRTAKVRIYFIINSNVTATRGAKNIYARIMRPDQLLLTKSPNNVFQFEDLKIPYSAMREVIYEGLDLPVAIYWDNEGEPEMMTGVYQVNLFADGNEIGETTFELK